MMQKREMHLIVNVFSSGSHAGAWRPKWGNPQGVSMNQLVPELQRRGLFREAYQTDTLRGRSGTPRPTGMYLKQL